MGLTSRATGNSTICLECVFRTERIKKPVNPLGHASKSGGYAYVKTFRVEILDYFRLVMEKHVGRD